MTDRDREEAASAWAAPDERTRRRVERLRFLTVDQMAALPDPEYLAHGLLPSPGWVILFGPPTSFKSFVALAMAYAIATGTDCFGRAVRQGSVLYVAAEGGVGFRKRLRAITRDANRKGLPLYVLPHSVDLGSPAEVAALLGEVERYRPALIVLDTFGRVTPGLDPDTAADMGRVLPVLEALQDVCGSTVLTTDHDNKKGGKGIAALTGSSVKGRACDALLRLERAARTLTTTLYVEKLKDDEEGRPIVLTLEPSAGSLIVARAETADATANNCHRHLAVVRALADGPAGLTATAWRQQSGLAERTFFRARSDLLAENLAAKRGSVYVVTDAGLALLSESTQLPPLPTTATARNGSQSLTAATTPASESGVCGSDLHLSEAA